MYKKKEYFCCPRIKSICLHPHLYSILKFLLEKSTGMILTTHPTCISVSCTHGYMHKGLKNSAYISFSQVYVSLLAISSKSCPKLSR